MSSLLTSVKAFFTRHRRKIFVSLGLFASGYFAIDYLKNKLFEIQDRLATERSAKENLRRRFEQNQEDATYTIMALLPTLSSDIIDTFPVEALTQELQAKRTEKAILRSSSKALSDATSDISNVTTGLVPKNTSDEDTKAENEEDSIVMKQEAGSESIVQVEKAPKKSKTQLWQELKIESITRLFTLIYSTSLLIFLTRLQLNILGRRNYVWSVLDLASQRRNKHHQEEITMLDMSASSFEQVEVDVDVESEDEETIKQKEHEAHINKMYLAISWWFINRGWISLSQQVGDAVRRVFGSVNPRSDLSLEKLSELIGQVQYLIDYPYGSDVPQNFLNNLLPPEELETYVFSQAFNTNDLGFEELPDELRSLIDETADFIESPNAGEVIKRLVHTGLSVSVSKISKLYPAVVDTPEKIVDVTEGDVAQQQEQATIKLASILANISRQAHSIAAGSPIDPNEYVVEMGNVGELNAFSAVVYSNFDWRVMDKDGKA